MNPIMVLIFIGFMIYMAVEFWKTSPLLSILAIVLIPVVLALQGMWNARRAERKESREAQYEYTPPSERMEVRMDNTGEGLPTGTPCPNCGKPFGALKCPHCGLYLREATRQGTRRAAKQLTCPNCGVSGKVQGDNTAFTVRARFRCYNCGYVWK